MNVLSEKLEILDETLLSQNENIFNYQKSRGRGWYKKSSLEGKIGFWAGSNNRSNILISTPRIGKYLISGMIKFKSDHIKEGLRVGLLDIYEQKPNLKSIDNGWYLWEMSFEISKEIWNLGVISFEFYCDIATNDRELRAGVDQNLQSFFIANICIKSIK